MPTERIPNLPDPLSALETIAFDLRWSWNHRARLLFKRLDPELWNNYQHNPVKLLHDIDPERLKRAAADPDFLREYEVTVRQWHETSDGKASKWYAREFPALAERKIAYFSAEFGIHTSLPIYSGGLGILAGDHCKESSDLGIPLIGVGFAYPQGYFHQRIQANGWQEDIYEGLERRNAPFQPASLDAAADPQKRFMIALEIGAARVFVEVWRVTLGSVTLYLMDTDVDENPPGDRELTARLYSGDKEHRIRQEIVLGIGGVRILRALGIAPAVFHANEGHTAFMMLERARALTQAGATFEQAAAAIAAATVFTTHTPVAAGHDAFTLELMDRHFDGYWDDLGLTRDQFMDLGLFGETFNMTALALRMAGWRNGVSQIHGRVTRRMWSALWPDRTEDDLPVMAVTNGVHAPTWIASELAQLFERYLGADWIEHGDDAAYWNRIAAIPDEELWSVRQLLKRKLIAYARERARARWTEDHVDARQVIAMGTLLNPDALTIGFARRFTGYKRASLIFTDLERIKKILLDPWRPVQIIFAGKAHPADEHGKHLIQQIYALAADSELAGHIAFVENYEIHSAHLVTQGVDVWLNNPRPPLEACGTSGQKAGMNGVLNVSVLDGWWYEGYNGNNGWAIGKPPEDLEVSDDDAPDAESLYHLLEEQIVPLYYERDRGGLPHQWIQMSKESIRSVAPQFSARRMLKEYASRMYAPAAAGTGPVPAPTPR